MKKFKICRWKLQHTDIIQYIPKTLKKSSERIWPYIEQRTKESAIFNTHCHHLS